MDFGPDSTNPVAFSQDDPDTLYLLTSLTAGSSSIITATSRLEHLLKSNKVPFKAVDLATDDRARGLWGRRGGGKRLPGVVKDGLVLGNYEDLEEWNEYGELKQNLGIKPTKKKKKKKSAESDPSISKRSTDLSGSTSLTTPMTSAVPNIASEELPSDAVSGVQAVLAAAAAAAGRNLKNTGSIRSFASADRPVTAIADGTVYEKHEEKKAEKEEGEEEVVVVVAESAALAEAAEKTEDSKADEERAEVVEVVEVETAEVMILTAATAAIEEVDVTPTLAPAPTAPEISEEKQTEATEAEKLAASVDAAFAFSEATGEEPAILEEPKVEELKIEGPLAEESKVDVDEKKEADNSWAEATMATIAAAVSAPEKDIEKTEADESFGDKVEIVEVKVDENEKEMETIEEEKEDEKGVEVKVEEKVEEKVEAEKVEEKKEDEKTEEKEADKVEEKKEEEKGEKKVEEKPVEKPEEKKAEEKVEKPKEKAVEKNELPVPQVQIQASEEKKEVEKEAEPKVKFSEKIDEKAAEKNKHKETTVEDGSEGKLKPEAAAGTPEDGDSGGKINKTRLFSWLRVRLSFKKSTGDLKKAPTTSASDRANLRKSRSTDELRKSTYALFRSKSIEKGLSFEKVEKVEKAADPAPTTTPVPATTPAITSTPAPTETPQ